MTPIELTTIETTTLETPAGPLFVAVHEGDIVALTFRRELKPVLRYLERRFPGTRRMTTANPGGVVPVLRRWLAGDAAALATLRPRTIGTPFQETVWRALRRIPAGSTVTYAELARRIGRPTAVRAVAAANGANPVAVLIPCHRVIGSDGSLTGYAGGLECKAWLLARESVRAAGSTGGAPRTRGDRALSR